jgi:WD40 repeat protein
MTVCVALLVMAAQPADGVPLPPGAVARIGSARFRVSVPLAALRFTSDGKTVLAATRGDAAVVAWDAATGRPRWRIDYSKLVEDNRTYARSLGVAGNELLLFVPGADPIPFVARFDLATGIETGRASLHRSGGGFANGQFSPDGRQIVLSGFKKIVAFDAATGTLGVSRETGYSPHFDPNGFSADGRRFAQADRAGMVVVYDTTTWADVQRFRPATRDSHLVRLSSDGKTVAVDSGDGHAVVLLAADTGRVLFTLPIAAAPDTFDLQGMTFSPDGRRLALIGDSERGGSALVLWDPATGKEVARHKTFFRPTYVAYSPDGQTIAVGYDYAIELRDAATGKRLPQSCDDPDCVRDVRFLPNGELVTIRGDVTVNDPRTGAELRRLPAPAEGHWRYLSADGTRVVRYADGPAEVRDVLTGRPPVKLPATTFFAVGVTPRDEVLVTVPEPTKTGHSAAIWDAAAGKPGRKIAILPRSVSAAAVTPGGRRAFAVCEPNADASDATRYTAELVIADLAAGRELARHTFVSERYPYFYAVSPDGRVVAVADSNDNDDDAGAYTRKGAAHLFDLENGRKLGVLRGHDRRIHDLNFSRDGRTLVTGADDHTIRGWELATRKERWSFRVGGTVGCAAISPDGRLAASASPDELVLVWDVYGLYGAERKAPLATASLETLWADLASPDATVGFNAIRALVADPDAAVRLIHERLKPAEPLDAAAVRQWLADLDAPAFAAREAAEKGLTRLAAEIAPALDEAAASAVSPEVRARLAAIRGHADTPPGPLVRGLRAVEVLEVVGTPGAKQVLAELGGGATGRRLTAEAKGAVERR